MSREIAPFAERYRRALSDPRLRANLLAFQRAWKTSRETAFGRLGEAANLGARSSTFTQSRAQLKAAKNLVLADPNAMRKAFIERATETGAVVHHAADAPAAREIVLNLLRERQVRLLAKGKSMVAEEIFLNHHLEAGGIRVVETDLGEWIIQLAHETPSHMVMPAIHKSRQMVADLFAREVQRSVDRENVKAMVQLAREELRRVFLEADAGLIGANALIAETGTVLLVTNEGNGDLVSTLPRTLVVIAGWEKLVPTYADAAAQLRLLARSATGQEITTYTSFLTRPEPSRELHLVLVDNGRSAMWQDHRFRDALRCIRCAACADVCPPYQVVGGHVFGYVYSGAIGLVNTPFHHGLDAAAGPQALCVSCHACATVCPVEIPLPRQILDVRATVVRARGLPLAKRLALGVWARPRLFDLALRLAAAATRPLRRGRSLRLPLPAAYAWRRAPALALRPARDDLFGRVFEPEQSGPWVQSGARGLTVAYFVQCLSDRFAPEQAYAAIRVLRACGARVFVPSSQHCCGLPHLDAGDLPNARRLAKHTIAGLEGLRADYVVTAAASCAIAMLHDYAHLLRDEPAWVERAQALATRTLDLLTFLDRVADPLPLSPADDRVAAAPLAAANSVLEATRGSPPLSPAPDPAVFSSTAPGATQASLRPAPSYASEATSGSPQSELPTVTVHPFCQSTNVLGLGNTGTRLLRRAGLRVADLPEAEVCCGFGGSTSLDYPEVGQGIVERKLANVAATGARVLATDNPGCLLHLRGSAEAAGLPLRAVHVAELLAERLDQVAIGDHRV